MRLQRPFSSFQKRRHTSAFATSDVASRTQDFVLLGIVLAAASIVRLVFLSVDPPLLLTTDSLTYALPAIHLITGEGFDLSLRRTPGYPLLVAGVWTIAGVDPQPLVYLQHMFGVASAGLTWFIGRLAFGRLAALLAGLAVGLSGSQIIYEHYLMTEALFTLLLVALLLVVLLAVRRGSAWLYLLSGLLCGLCALTRPIGQILPLFVLMAALFATGSWSHRGNRLGLAARAGLLVLIGFAIVMLPWVARNRLVGGELTSSSALGKTLFGRITRHDDGFRYDLPPAGPSESDPERARARGVARDSAHTDTSRGSLVHERLMREFGYSEAQAYNVMRDVALEVILAQPAYYLRSSLLGTLELFLGQDEPFRAHLERLANPRLRREWQERPELAGLLPRPVSAEQRGQTLGSATSATRLFQPSNDPFARPILLLFLTGGLAMLLRSAWRVVLFIPITALALLTLSAFLDGPVIRFRYPLDPAISLAAAAGVVGLLDLARYAARVGWRAPASGVATPEPRVSRPL